MTAKTMDPPDPRLDLVLERTVDVRPELVWEAWTKPEHLKHWFVPAPWTITECEIDLRPGGVFRTVMRSPEGEESPGVGCYLEVVPNERLVWTDALLPGYRPSEEPFFTAVIEIAPAEGGGTRYTATAIHRDEEGRKKHEEMGFHEGWGTVLDQLVEYARTLQVDASPEYEPVDCGFHDRLEDAAVRGRPCRVRWRDPRGAERSARTRIEDVFARTGEEFVRLAGGEEVRLDRILEFAVDEGPSP